MAAEDSKHAALGRSHARVAALADVCDRFGAIVGVLLHGIDDVLPHLEGDEKAAAGSVVRDASAQLAAIDDVLTAVTRDLG